VRIWNIVALLTCLNACANHGPAAEVVSDSPSSNVAIGGRRHPRCVAVDAGADGGADADAAVVAASECDEEATGGGGGGGGSGTWVDDSNNPDDSADDPGDESTGDESGGDGSSTLESAHVSQKTAKGHGHRHGKKSKTARQTTK